MDRGREFTIIRTAAVLASTLLFFMLPACAGAASSASFDDPIGDMTYYAPDLGATTVTVADDDTITVDTRIVPRPPAFWGGCAYPVGIFPYETCVPADMNVTWYLDFSNGAGSVADGGADAKIMVIPRRGQTFWESSRWDTANGRFSAGAKPLAAEDEGGARWTLNLADLGIPKPATVRIRVGSLYKSYNGLGTLLNYADEAGPGTVSIAGPPAAPAPAVPGANASCTQATARVNNLQRKIRSATRRARKGSRSARRRLARLRRTRKRALATMESACGSPVEGPPPASAPPGCRLVTKTVLKQEGIGIYAKWVLKPEVVVECSK